MINTRAALLAMFLLTSALCWAILRPAQQYTNPHQYTLTAVVYQPSSPTSPTFTFQGVFSDPQTGNPIDGPANIRIGIADGSSDSDPILFLTDVSPSYTNGRFTANVDLLDPKVMLNINDPHIVILSADGKDTPIIPRIPMSYAPYAWTAEYAREAGLAQQALLAAEADVAQEADFSKFANTAAIAESLANSSSTTLIAQGAWFGELRADRIGNLVVLSGRATTNTNNTLVTTLPEGYRPSTILYFSVMGAGFTNQQVVEARVEPDGGVFVDTTNAAIDAANLGGIIFTVDP